MADERLQRCALCGRLTPVEHLSKHHVLPRSRGGRDTEPLCRTCHGHVHATFTNKQLETEYDTIEKLRNAPQMAAYLAWIAKQKPTRQFRRRRSKARARRP